jgi:hypothetical protein
MPNSKGSDSDLLQYVNSSGFLKLMEVLKVNKEAQFYWGLPQI